MLPVDGHQAVLLVDLLGAKQALQSSRQSWALLEKKSQELYQAAQVAL